MALVISRRSLPSLFSKPALLSSLIIPSDETIIIQKADTLG
jgi:hypothetical protein